MKADNEMHFVDNTNYQSLETAPPQNLTSVQNLPPVVLPNYVPVPNFVPNDSPISSRLIFELKQNVFVLIYLAINLFLK